VLQDNRAAQMSQLAILVAKVSNLGVHGWWYPPPTMCDHLRCASTRLPWAGGWQAQASC